MHVDKVVAAVLVQHIGLAGVGDDADAVHCGAGTHELQREAERFSGDVVPEWRATAQLTLQNGRVCWSTLIIAHPPDAA